MPSRIRRALGVAVVAAAAAAAVAVRLAAQGTPAPAPAPQVTVTGVVYTQFLYQLNDTLTPHFNSFDIPRAYVNVLGKFTGGVNTRVTADVYRNTDGSLAYRLKYAFATYTPEGSQLTYKLGLIHTPWLDWEEALWDYRMQGQMAFERAGYISAADFGVGVDGKWGADKVNLQVTVVNGEYYRSPETGQGKDAQARLSVRVMDTDDNSRVGGLRITGYAAYGKTTAGGQRNRLLGMVSYRTKQLTLAGEAAATQDGILTGPTATNGHLYSAFGVAKVPDSKVAIIARVDIWHPQAGNTTDKLTRFIGGLSYQLTPNWRLLGDIDYLSYQGTPTAAQDAFRSQALFQTQFTF
jgi:hypothetical protein